VSRLVGSEMCIRDRANGEKFECRYPVGRDVKLTSVEVYEHAGNSAIFEG
jgi:hypothetical protein